MEGVWIEYINLSYTIECRCRSIRQYESLGVRKGSEGVWVTIDIFIAIPNVVRVWQFTVYSTVGRGYCKSSGLVKSSALDPAFVPTCSTCIHQSNRSACSGVVGTRVPY